MPIVPDEPETRRSRIVEDTDFFPGTEGMKDVTAPTPRPLRERMEQVGSAAGLTGVAAVGLPYALQAFPYTRPLGMALRATGPFMRGLSGAVAGGVSETAGQAAELAGATPQVAELARFAPAPGQAAIEGLGVYLGGRLAGPIRYLQRATEPGMRSAETRAAVRALEGGQPQAPETVAGALREAGRAREAAIPGVEAAARVGRERTAGLMGAAEARTGRAQAASAELRSRIGEPRSATDVGQELRTRIVSNKEAELAQRSANYQQDLAARDAAVQARVGAGENITDLPEYKAVVEDLRSKLLIGKQPAERKLTDVTEQGVESALRRIYDSITPRRVQTQVGIDPVGQPIFETREFKPSFQAIDDVRRKMGDLAFGKEVEGYEGITRNIAKDMYEKLSNLQRRFAGDAQDILQSRYEEASTLLSRFQGRAGQRATAVDKFNAEEFATDPARLPTTYFSSPTGVKNLIELTGDRALVEKAAREFASSQIANMNAKQVDDYIRKSDWLRSVPQLQADLARYQAGLARTEQIGARGEQTVTGLRKRMGREGERAAGRIEDIRKEAAMIAGDPRPGERMERLILSAAAPEELRVVGQFISQNPAARQAFPDAVRVTIANRVSPTNMTYEWQQNVRPLLEGSGLVQRSALDAIERDIQRVAQTLEPAKRVPWLQNTVGKLLAIGAQRGVVSASEAMGI